MSKSRRVLTLAVMLVVLGAVPASAATWRNVASVRADGDARYAVGPYSQMFTTARNVSKVRVGFHSYSQARNVRYDYEVHCINPEGNVTSTRRAGAGLKATGSGDQFVTIWERPRTMHVCDIWVVTQFAGSATTPVRTKIQVQ